MKINFNDKEYNVTELSNKWKLVRTIGNVTAEYEIPKEACSTLSNLKNYIRDNAELF